VKNTFRRCQDEWAAALADAGFDVEQVRLYPFDGDGESCRISRIGPSGLPRQLAISRASPTDGHDSPVHLAPHVVRVEGDVDR
jgi:hypothetical protein